LNQQPNTRINADAPRLLFAGLGFKALLSLLAYSTAIRAPVMRKVVIGLGLIHWKSQNLEFTILKKEDNLLS
jgi:hypothetical protein